MPILPHGLFRRLPITMLLLTVAPAALAQAPSGAVVQPLSRSNDPAELLAQALRTLATEPANLSALTAAGRNALILGDPNAAVGFFGRAQEIAPTNGAVKAGLGSALVQLEKPQDALRLFADASRLGVPDADIAEDRGLAYDLTGQQSLAQRDYQTVLAGHPDDDTARRRLALSQGISGNKAAAIATLDPLIRKRDIAGWRAQTFVLAMDGDAKGANDITRIMLPQQSAMLQPFLLRLAKLSPADKARAVHFGEMPSSGTPYTPTQMASIDTPPTYASAPAPAPHSDLVVSKPPVASVPAAKQTVPTQVASASPLRQPVQRATEAAVRDRDANLGLDKSAPLAGIALTPAQVVQTKPVPSAPAVTTVAQTSPGATPAPVTSSASPTQLAQASSPNTLAGPPAPLVELPTPAAEGHYDLPHDSVAKGVARAPRPTQAAAPMKTVGTPVVHGKAAAPAVAVADDSSAEAIRSKPAKSSLTAKERSVSDDDADATPSKSRSRASEADETATKSKKVLASIDDCAPVSKSKSKTRGRAAKASARCTSLASTDADDSVATKGKKSAAIEDDCAPAPKSRSRAKGKAAKASVSCTRVASGDDEDSTITKTRKMAATADDCPPVSKSKRKTKGKASKLSASCTRLASVDDDDDSPAKTTKGRKASADDADTRPTKSSRSAKSADKPAAERVYVQVAGGANKDDMDKAWSGVKKKAPDLMKGHAPLTTPLKATNRLLVGPFKDEDEAQAFVNKMATKGLSGFTFKSSKGQKVEKVDSGG
jgi:Flp pilus assembly protein TadD